MAHFAELDEDNVVLRVLVVNNEVITENGEEKEQLGVDFLANLYGGIWKQTSYNKNFRKHYAGKGFIYNQTRDAFMCPQPYPSWTLVEDTCEWEAPTPYPDDGKMYDWDEDSTSWVAVP